MPPSHWQDRGALLLLQNSHLEITETTILEITRPAQVIFDIHSTGHLGHIFLDPFRAIAALPADPTLTILSIGRRPTSRTQILDDGVFDETHSHPVFASRSELDILTGIDGHGGVIPASPELCQ